MQGEHHDIDHEFPEFHEKLETLRAKNGDFDTLVAQHDALDDQIRRLEEKQSPISDYEIEKLKYRRASLKDQIYQRLRIA